MVVGAVAALWRYPVKSMLGERLDALAIEPRGAVGDRRYAVRDEMGKLGSGKHTRRFRRIEGLFRFRARLDGAVPVVTLPDGTVVRADDPAVHVTLSAALGLPVTLAREAGVSHFDAGPLHLVTCSALRTIGSALGAALDERRFRPNLLLDAPGDGFVEDRWLGRELTVGDEVRLRVTASTERCTMVGFAQAELSDEPGVLREVVRRNAARLGVYAEVLAPGTVRVGDRVRVR